MLQSVRNGWVSSEKRRSKRREKERTKGTRAREPWWDAERTENERRREKSNASDTRKA